LKLFGLEIGLSRKDSGVSIDTIIRRLEAIQATQSGVNITPDTAMQSPTVQAIVTAISRRIATLPVRVLRKTTVDNRDRKEVLPNHPVAKLLKNPNGFQDNVSFWLDGTSWLVRYGNFYGFKSRGKTGPIRQLIPLHPTCVQVEQDDHLNVSYVVHLADGKTQTYSSAEVLHARGAARDGLKGDSPIMDIREAIALEIASEKMGASVFGNGAMPSLVFSYADGFQGHRTDEERARFVENFQQTYSNNGRFKAMLLPKGIEVDQPISIDNEKAQFLATRQYQRSVIAGAFGVPPHLVGDLSRGTFNNVEQQSLDFVLNVVLPYVRIFEAAMERSLLTDEDRNSGVQIRFNLEGALRGDFKSRQEGLKIQREMGVISPNDWREQENMNPISEEDGGETYWMKGPSGQGMEAPTDDNSEADDTEEDNETDEGVTQ
jgi:HK97 family phage portal protein